MPDMPPMNTSPGVPTPQLQQARQRLRENEDGIRLLSRHLDYAHTAGDIMLGRVGANYVGMQAMMRDLEREKGRLEALFPPPALPEPLSTAFNQGAALKANQRVSQAGRKLSEALGRVPDR
jgi:hypothetical protein